MRKFITFILVLLTFVAVAQTTKKVTMFSATSVPGATSTTYTTPISWAAPFAVEVKVTPTAFNRTDSTVVKFQGSIDQTTWYTYPNMGTPVTSAGTNATLSWRTTVNSLSVIAASTSSAYTGGSAFWTPTTPEVAPYFRTLITHYGTDTVAVTGYLYVKP